MTVKNPPNPPGSNPNATKKVGSSTQPCPLQDDAKIVSIAFLDGDDNTEVASARQFVNLPRDAQWVDGTDVKNIDRLGHRPRIKVRFDKPGCHKFKVKMLADAGNVIYSPDEQRRNANFRFQGTQRSYSTDKDGSKILPLRDFFVSSAGKNKFKLEAEDDNGNIVKTGDLEVHRLLYYVEIKMRTLTSIASSLSTFEQEFAKHNIKLKALPSVQMPHIPNIGDTQSDYDTLQNNARTAYDTAVVTGKRRYVVAMAYTDHLAVKYPKQTLIKSGVRVGRRRPPVVIPIIGPGSIQPNLQARELWKNLVPGEGWFVSARFLENGGFPGIDDEDIAESKITPIGDANGNNCRKVSVDVTALPKATGTITLTVNWVDYWAGGMAFPGTGLICVCTRSFWSNFPAVWQNKVMIHELGHTTGMVADGTGKLPDAVTTLYTGKGHIGPHCHEGNPAGQARYDSSTDETNSKCVMYGNVSNISKSNFCINCAPAVRKVDISAGWNKF